MLLALYTFDISISDFFVIPVRLERTARTLKVYCSNQLSYEIVFFQYVKELKKKPGF
jgi:hypothetical protein